MAVTNTK